MTRCLRDKTLFLLTAAGGDRGQWLHLKTCERCAERYRRTAQDLELITSTLRQEPPMGALTDRPIPVLYKAAPVIAAVLFAVALIWGEGRFLHSNLPQSSAQLASDDWSQLLEQVSEALFPGAASSHTEATPAGSDWVFVQNALGEDCFAECKELFTDLAAESSAGSKKPNDQLKVKRVPAYRAR